MAIFEVLENYLKVIEYPPSFHQFSIVCINGESFSIVLPPEFPRVLEMQDVKVFIFLSKTGLFLHFQLCQLLKSEPVRIFERKLSEMLAP